MAAATVLSLAAHHPPVPEATTFYVLDFTPVDAPYADLLDRVLALVPHGTRRVGRRGVAAVMAEVAAEVDRRLAADEPGTPPIYLVIHGLMRARDLRPDDDLGFGSPSFSFGDESAVPPPDPSKQFPNILREGPDLGVHTIAWCDTFANLNRTLDRRSLREFDMRVAFQMGADDSSNLIDSPAASKLGPHRAIFYSEELGIQEKFRPYGLPPEGWLSGAAVALQRRSAPAAE